MAKKKTTGRKRCDCKCVTTHKESSGSVAGKVVKGVVYTIAAVTALKILSDK